MATAGHCCPHQRNPQRHCGAVISHEHPRVAGVRYPGLATSEQKQIVDAQMRVGGMLSAVLDAGAGQTAAVVDRLRLFAIAPSLGGVESLVTQPITTTHQGLDPTERAKRGIADRMVRLSVGLEDADDLIARPHPGPRRLNPPRAPARSAHPAPGRCTTAPPLAETSAPCKKRPPASGDACSAGPATARSRFGKET
ncbi:PLP-dependent transferase [Streptomyces sp. ADMS]|uniref:PLP-dependent transferase n=1 Tax=Streptomyces sp. ADMS TaxID=3071415 RepID=UPI00296E800F|nr:PLP-dependent transferase [Streptomyces sp. ADMS]MDW4911076.1 PLP-dependent transferase [Streptomyces sp. ADMS]